VNTVINKKVEFRHLGLMDYQKAWDYQTQLFERSVAERNYRYKRAEIDLIAQKDECIVFVEVKTRSSNAYGHPEEAVNEKKARKIVEGAEHYVQEKEWAGNIRFDIVAVSLGAEFEIRHFEDAFY